MYISNLNIVPYDPFWQNSSFGGLGLLYSSGVYIGICYGHTRSSGGAAFVQDGTSFPKESYRRRRVSVTDIHVCASCGWKTMLSMLLLYHRYFTLVVDSRQTPENKWHQV